MRTASKCLSLLILSVQRLIAFGEDRISPIIGGNGVIEPLITSPAHSSSSLMLNFLASA